MTEYSYPFDGQAIYEDDWGSMARLWRSSCVDYESTNKLAPSFPAALTTRVASGRAFVRGFAYSNDSNIDWTHATVAGSGQKRIDTVVLRKDSAANKVSMVLVPGTAAVTPVAPTLQTAVDVGQWDFPLYDALVTNGSTTVVISDRRFIWGPGQRLIHTLLRAGDINSQDSWVQSQGWTNLFNYTLPANGPTGRYRVSIDVVLGIYGGSDRSAAGVIRFISNGTEIKQWMCHVGGIMNSQHFQYEFVRTSPVPLPVYVEHIINAITPSNAAVTIYNASSTVQVEYIGGGDG